MRFQSTSLATAVALVSLLGACKSDLDPAQSSGGGSGTRSGGSSGNGGATGNGGSTSSGGQAGGSSGSGGSSSCSNVAADVAGCGGEVTGTWTVTPSCLKWSGNLDISLAGLDPNTCKSPTIEGFLTVSGSWTANSNGTYQDGTTTSGTATIQLPAGCLRLSGTTTTCSGIAGPMGGIGYSAINCTEAAGGGCTCLATIQQTGGIGVVSPDPQASGNFTTAGNVVTTDGAAKYSYCAQKNEMKWTPQTANPATTGAITFQKIVTPGVGGSTGQGGQAGAGGAAGGTVATGGRTGQGGGPGSGGIARDGGQDGPSGSGGAGGSTGTGGTAGSGGSTARGTGPCDIYAAASPATPCVAAYSMTRAMSKSYSGFLYQVRSGSSASNTGTGGTTKDIGMTVDGYADIATQDTFCSGTTCTVSILYDQSGNNNNLTVAKKGRSDGGQYAAMDDFESAANKGAVTAGGHKVYSLYMNAREGYRTGLNVKGKGMPLGNTSEGIYMLADGTHSGAACCWDFGNVSPDPMTYGVMNTLFLGTGFWGKGAGSGPWFLGDFEGGVWAGGSGASTAVNNSNPSMKVPFALGFLKTSPGKYALRMADVATATDLTTAYDGNSPKTWNNEGGILLGIGGDNSNNSWGTFYEGCITSGLPSNATDLAILNNIKAVGYKK